MGRSSTTFSSTYQPLNRKGKNERTKLIEALDRADYTEEQFYDLIIEKALSDDGALMMKDVFLRMSPAPKSTLPCYEFDFDESSTYAQQASQIINAASNGQIPPDVASLFVSAITSMLKVQEVTDLDERLKKLEEVADEQI